MKAVAALLLAALLAPAAGAAWIDPLPERSARSEDFYSIFSRGVFEQETGLAAPTPLSCAADGACGGFQASTAWLLGSQERLVSRAAERALRAQYALDQWSAQWLAHPWDLEKGGLAAVVSAAFLYTDGLHFHEQAAGWSVRGTVAAARQLRTEDSRLATLDLSRVGSPLTLSAAWGREAPAFGARWSLRY